MTKIMDTNDGRGTRSTDRENQKMSTLGTIVTLDFLGPFRAGQKQQ